MEFSDSTLKLKAAVQQQAHQARSLPVSQSTESLLDSIFKLQQ